MTKEQAKEILWNRCQHTPETAEAIRVLSEERPQGEMIETKHRLNLLIGVLYSNQLISENDIEYIEDSIKKLIKGGAKNDKDSN